MQDVIAGRRGMIHQAHMKDVIARCIAPKQSHNMIVIAGDRKEGGNPIENICVVALAFSR